MGDKGVDHPVGLRLQHPRPCHVARPEGLIELDKVARQQVVGRADGPVDANGEHGGQELVRTAEHVERAPAEGKDLLQQVHVKRAVLEPLHVGDLAQRPHLFRSERHPRRAGNIVQVKGQRGSAGDQLIVLYDALKADLVVKGWNRRYPICADLLGMGSQGERVGGRGCAHVHDHGHSPAGLLDRHLGHTLALCRRQQDAFAGAATHVQPTDPGVDQMVDQLAGHGDVDLLVLGQRSKERGPYTCETGHLVLLLLMVSDGMGAQRSTGSGRPATSGENP